MKRKKNHISECHTITPCLVLFSKLSNFPDAAFQKVILTQQSRRSTPVCCSHGSGTFQELCLGASPRPASGSVHPQTNSSHPDVANSSRLPSTHTYWKRQESYCDIAVTILYFIYKSEVAFLNIVSRKNLLKLTHQGCRSASPASHLCVSAVRLCD